MNVTRLKSSLETNSFWRFAPQLGGGEVSGNYPRIMEEERGTSSYLANPIQAQLKFKIKTTSVLTQIRKGRKGHCTSYPTEQTQFAHIFTKKLVFCTIPAVLGHYTQVFDIIMRFETFSPQWTSTLYSGWRVFLFHLGMVHVTAGVSHYPIPTKDQTCKKCKNEHKQTFCLGEISIKTQKFNIKILKLT